MKQQKESLLDRNGKGSDWLEGKRPDWLKGKDFHWLEIANRLGTNEKPSCLNQSELFLLLYKPIPLHPDGISSNMLLEKL